MDEGEEVRELRFASSGDVRPGLVKDAVLGAERDALWEKLRTEHASRIDDLPETSAS